MFLVALDSLSIIIPLIVSGGLGALLGHKAGRTMFGVLTFLVILVLLLLLILSPDPTKHTASVRLVHNATTAVVLSFVLSVLINYTT